MSDSGIGSFVEYFSDSASTTLRRRFRRNPTNETDTQMPIQKPSINSTPPTQINGIYIAGFLSDINPKPAPNSAGPINMHNIVTM
ncbi:unnamed protein product [Adineta steineri]|uniref:Uncharacterized protein n=1 Tax=Adineta steineri TaxID=433720 RepID=A0A819W6R3_9BILA|nr:unnamed protein product [Adineta steineri]CAF1507829.1 unnamed protein product [Adineta steineri]CAF4045809.1 unnamed protein product [Adineta steineri]CAF4121034.1 unnamed protein product [Adineta steineri]